MPEQDSPHPISESLAAILRDEGFGPDELNQLLTVMHPVDLAEFLDDLPPDDRVELFRLMEDERGADVLDSMDHDSRLEIVGRLSEDRLSRIINQMNPDTVADILPSLPEHREVRVLEKVEQEHREDIRSLRRFAPHTAGGIMTTNFVSAPDSSTCAAALRAIQGNVDAETIEYIYVVDPGGRLRGVCTLRTILMAKPETSIESVMKSEEVIFVGHTLDQEDVARVVHKYGLKAVPVVDNSFKLIGVVTVDDVLEIIQQEASEDIFKMAGADRLHPLHDTVMRRVRARLPWLAATVIIQLGIAWTIRGYEDTLQKFWLLSAFFPIIMAIGGNVGLQSATLVVRGLATGEITVGRSVQVLLAEVRVGVLIGGACGAVSGLMAYLMNMGGASAVEFGVIVAVSMLSGITFAAAFGTVIPFGCQRMGVDPAIASGPFITTLNDILSIVIYLSLASLLIL